MTKTITPGPDNTWDTSAGNAHVDFPVNCPDWDGEFAIVSQSPTEIVYTDLTSPTDQPSTRRLAVRKIANIYAGTDVAPSQQLANRAGRQILLELREMWKETSDTDDSYVSYGPARFTAGITVPAGWELTPDDVKNAFVRMLSTFAVHNTDEMGSDPVNEGIKPLLRDALPRHA